MLSISKQFAVSGQCMDVEAFRLSAAHPEGRSMRLDLFLYVFVVFTIYIWFPEHSRYF